MKPKFRNFSELYYVVYIYNTIYIYYNGIIEYYIYIIILYYLSFFIKINILYKILKNISDIFEKDCEKDRL